jgi:hypothetical protein
LDIVEENNVVVGRRMRCGVSVMARLMLLGFKFPTATISQKEKRSSESHHSLLPSEAQTALDTTTCCRLASIQPAKEPRIITRSSSK